MAYTSVHERERGVTGEGVKGAWHTSGRKFTMYARRVEDVVLPRVWCSVRPWCSVQAPGLSGADTMDVYIECE